MTDTRIPPPTSRAPTPTAKTTPSPSSSPASSYCPPEAVAELEARRDAAQAGLTSAERHRARALLIEKIRTLDPDAELNRRLDDLAATWQDDAEQSPAELARQGIEAALGLTERLGGRGLPAGRSLAALDPDQRARAVALQVADDVLLVREDATVGDLLALADYIVTGTRATDGAGQ